MLGAAISLIVLFAVPSLAQAHAGHHQAELPMAASVLVLQADTISATQAETLAVFVQSKDQMPGKDNSGCGGLSCCGSAPCPSCASVISLNNADLEPHSVSSVSLPHNAPAVAGIGPQDLSRPPKSFV